MCVFSVDVNARINVWNDWLNGEDGSRGKVKWIGQTPRTSSSKSITFSSVFFSTSKQTVPKTVWLKLLHYSFSIPILSPLYFCVWLSQWAIYIHDMIDSFNMKSIGVCECCLFTSKMFFGWTMSTFLHCVCVCGLRDWQVSIKFKTFSFQCVEGKPDFRQVHNWL